MSRWPWPAHWLWRCLPIAVKGKAGKSLTSAIGDGESNIHLRTDDGSINDTIAILAEGETTMKPRCLQPRVVIGLTALSFLSIGGCDIQFGDFGQAKYERTVSRQIACEPNSMLDVATQSGSITIAGTDSNECSLTARIVGRAPTEQEAQELAEQVEIRSETADRVLKIRADKPHLANNRSVGVSYEMTVPRRLNILCQSDYGSLSVARLQGTIKGKTSSGSIKAEQIEGPLDLDTSYGSIDCRSSAGPTVLLRSSSGSIAATDLKGEAKIVTSYGSITCDTFSGTRLDLKTDSGRIAISNASFRDCLAVTSYGSLACQHLKGDSIKLRSGSGSLDLTALEAPALDLSTSYGSIKAQEITTAKLIAGSGSGSIIIVCTPATPVDLTAEVKSSYGGIDFTAPPGFSGQVDLRTDYGSIRTALPVTVSGEISKKRVAGRVGEGKGLLRLQTGSGSISLK
jgi:DUF4097 and DUF4098 domain-containing protein YvlB